MSHSATRKPPKAQLAAYAAACSELHAVLSKKDAFGTPHATHWRDVSGVLSAFPQDVLRARVVLREGPPPGTDGTVDEVSAHQAQLAGVLEASTTAFEDIPTKLAEMGMPGSEIEEYMRIAEPLWFTLVDLEISIRHSAGVVIGWNTEVVDAINVARETWAHAVTFFSRGLMTAETATAEGWTRLPSELTWVGDTFSGELVARLGTASTILANAVGSQQPAKEPRYRPPNCPKCDNKASVTSTQGGLRYLKCEDCAHTWKTRG